MSSEIILCKNLKRNFISCEIHPDYYQMILDRLDNNGAIKDEYRLDFIQQKTGKTLTPTFDLFAQEIGFRKNPRRKNKVAASD